MQTRNKQCLKAHNIKTKANWDLFAPTPVIHLFAQFIFTVVKKQIVTLRIYKVRTWYTSDFWHSEKSLFSIVNVLFVCCLLHVWQRWRKIFLSNGKGALAPTCAPKVNAFPKVLDVCAGWGDTLLNLTRVYRFLFCLTIKKRFLICLTIETRNILSFLCIGPCHQGNSLWRKRYDIYAKKSPWSTRGPSRWGHGYSACFLSSFLIQFLKQNYSSLIFPNKETIWVTGSQSTYHP